MLNSFSFNWKPSSHTSLPTPINIQPCKQTGVHGVLSVGPLTSHIGEALQSGALFKSTSNLFCPKLAFLTFVPHLSSC